MDIYNQICHWLCLLIITLMGCSHSATSRFTTDIRLADKKGANTFTLVEKSEACPIYIDTQDATVVLTAVNHFADDVKLVSGVKPVVYEDDEVHGHQAVIVGTIGSNKLIDQLIAQNKLDVNAIKGQWESSIIATIDNPMPGLDKALVIAGSDRRGTAYGVFTLSESIGVSPWYWWADIIPQKRKALYIPQGVYVQGSPSVKYRGIFINDEGFGGLNVWARKTYETEIGDIGPKTYARVFELLLRLKANYCWPAMHACTKPFYYYEENPVVADNYAIVIGTSHCEQMHCNTMTEWNEKEQGPWNYKVNPKRIKSFWHDRVDRTKNYENIYTLGMRGTEDIEMQGAESIDEMVDITRQTIADQRQILETSVGKKAEDIPQVLCTYKEVLVTYQNGLEVPDDVTLLWADDNHGYTRQLCTPEEQQRSGGSGVYYHLSLLGTPEGYLWLNTISPSLVAYEMTKAYQYGADRIWMFNVGDIKPHEKELTFAMQMAWDINRWTPNNAYLFMEEWAENTFGKETAKDIAAVMADYYRLAEAGKPEHCYRLDYSPEELDQRIEAYRNLAERAGRINDKLPEDLKAAFYQLVEYPVLGCRWMNERNLLARRSLQKAAMGNLSALGDAGQAKYCHAQLDSITHHYNAVNAGGKWNHIMSWHPWMSDKMPEVATDELVQKAQSSPLAHTVQLSKVKCHKALVLNDGMLQAAKDSKQHADSLVGHYTWDSERTGQVPVWIFATIPTSYVPSYCLAVNGKEIKSPLKHIGNIWHTQAAAPVWYKVGHVNITKGVNALALSLPDSLLTIGGIHLGWYPPSRPDYSQHIMSIDYVASHNSKESSVMETRGLGIGSGVSITPFTSPSLKAHQYGEAAWIEYEIAISKGQSEIEIRTLPTQRIHDGRGLCYAVSINDEEVQAFNVQADEFTPEWQDNVIRGFTSRKVNYSAVKDESIRLRIYFLDPGLVIRDIVVY
ncbi:glycosyl hydrolase 115 family protein [Carboxylicivirga mesophila]|uniref:Glycosyl hydrolase 115 family protein n=1 Tax=Carboxylicivirga mesophila TaxID=1166478 RepID=A0ABS5K8H0_9BACT|nr:glycosyl hydrolase 115 family protein [Carboxylicivirga mesophila]MBS2210678.1 glycosyl hydrolase 115 family protein [Carboxylicivirga mesophila]